PHCPAFGFPEFVSICFFNQFGSERVGGASVFATDELSARDNITPLIGSPHLEDTTLMLPEIVEIISLYQLIGKLGKGQSVFSFKALFYGILSHHVIDRDVFSHLTYKIEKMKAFEPIVIIYHDRPLFGI